MSPLNMSVRRRPEMEGQLDDPEASKGGALQAVAALMASMAFLMSIPLRDNCSR